MNDVASKHSQSHFPFIPELWLDSNIRVIYSMAQWQPFIQIENMLQSAFWSDTAALTGTWHRHRGRAMTSLSKVS